MERTARAAGRPYPGGIGERDSRRIGCAVVSAIVTMGLFAPVLRAQPPREEQEHEGAEPDGASAAEREGEQDQVAEPDGTRAAEREGEQDQAAEPGRAATGDRETRPDSLPELPAEDAQAIEDALAADREQMDARAQPEPGSDAASDEAQSPLAQVQRGAARALNPALSFILDVAGGWFSDDDHLQTGGHDPSQTGFNLQQLELAFEASVDPFFRVDGYIVFFLFGVEVEEIFATTLDLPAQLQLRVGQFKSKFGRINPIHMHTWELVDQPFVIGRYFGGESLRGLGAEISWLTPLPWYVELLLSTQMATGASTARSFYGADDLGVDKPGDLLYVARVEQFFPLSDDWSLLWGLSGAFGPNSTGQDNRTEVYGTDLYLKWRPITRQGFQEVSLTAEWMHRRMQVPAEVLWDVSGYAQLHWRFARRWATTLRYEYGSPSRSLDGDIAGAENTTVAAHPVDPDWVDGRHRGSGALSFWPSHFSRIRLQGSVDVPTWRDEPIYAAFLQTEFVTGAHGAHEF